jgi:hypothetical protein
MLQCGSCTAPQTCGGGGTPNLCGCTPDDAAACAGKNCGSVVDNCGLTVTCGTCLPPTTCGGGGVPNVCACAQSTCAAQGKNCGSIPDGCGGMLQCGGCVAPLSCGGGGAPNVCGCTPTTCAAQGKNCGTIPNGCGGILGCGGCGPNLRCVSNVCGCGPAVSFATQVQPIFNNNCTSCHPTSGSLSLLPADAYGQLVGQASATCPGWQRVVPTMPGASLLYNKLSLVFPACGSQMPPGPALPQAQLDIIFSWICEGAPNN